MDRWATTARPESVRLPRARGDGPQSRRASASGAQAPPRTRGWTAGRGWTGRPLDGSPAHAGMDRSDCASAVSRRGLPRARGDGPHVRQGRHQRDGAPPRTRGWTPPAAGVLAGRVGSPAHAGMDRPARRRRRTRGRLPRARGDGPAQVFGNVQVFEAPPRTRGWTDQPHDDQQHDDGSPAHAGMDQKFGVPAHIRTGLPRARGDGPRSGFQAARSAGAPPRTRGWTERMRRRGAPGRGSPAHAGMDRRWWRSGARPGGLPRARGDGPRGGAARARRRPAPPRTRGWTGGQRTDGLGGVGSPAHAGMDRSAGCTALRPGRLPRARGDGPRRCRLLHPRPLAPPRTRGWTRVEVLQRASLLGSPAHAGMDRDVQAGTPPPARLPRARGDGPRRAGAGDGHRQAPPRTRGWTGGRPAARGPAVGSPAHAGMDRVGRAASSADGRLPRARGDGPWISAGSAANAPTPPRTRGWTGAPEQPVVRDADSPAHAGMDPKPGRTTIR